MTDTGRVVSSIEGDRVRRPWVILRGYGLYGVDLSKGALPLLFGYVSGIYHVHSFYLWRELLLSTIDRTAGLIIVLAAWDHALLLGCEFAGLFEHPTVTVGVVGGLVLSAMDLARPLHDFVQRGGSVAIAFRRLLPLPGSRVAEAGVDGRVVGVTSAVPAFIFVASWFPVSIPSFGGAGVFGVVASSR
jgi:hypothetical protein